MIAPRHKPCTPWERQALCVPALLATATRHLLEIGPGNGEFLLHLARAEPTSHVIGIELKSSRFAKLRRRCASLPNVSLIAGDARTVLTELAPQPRFDAIYIQFPDPWPKRRHTPHRLMQPAFLALCTHALSAHGRLHFITDDADYAENVAHLASSQPQLASTYPHPIVTENPDAFPTYFSQKWRRAGRTIYYQQYARSMEKNVTPPTLPLS